MINSVIYTIFAILLIALIIVISNFMIKYLMIVGGLFVLVWLVVDINNKLK